ncbi:MAG: hypothetical protein AAF412_03385 [Pseudomonadota bacterium]
MPAPKGSRNASEYQNRLISQRVARLNEALSGLNSAGVHFQNITKLSKYLEELVDISHVSIRRNKSYRRLLEAHLSSQPGAAHMLTGHQQDVNVLKARITTLELEKSNRINNIRRLEAALANQNDTRGSTAPKRPLCRDEVKDTKPSSEFSATAQLALALINWLPGIFVDYERRVVFDPHSMSGNEIIASEELAGPFVDWMLSNQPEWVVDATRKNS